MAASYVVSYRQDNVSIRRGGFLFPFVVGDSVNMDDFIPHPSSDQI